jgi:hypothetical protein
MKRNRFHSICPYFAMFPESFALKWILKLTKPGDTVLDPFSGRGTTALTALLSGRSAVACDVNDVAFCLTAAKTNPPAINTLKRRIRALAGEFSEATWASSCIELPTFFHHAFNQKTLAQILYLRSTLAWRTSPKDSMIAALVLGSLHGESKANSPYFSNQMPRTIITKPAYSIKFWRDRNLVAPERNIFEILKSRAIYRYESPRPSGNAVVLNKDMRTLPAYMEKWAPARCVITSPPYLNTTSFEEDQWLRLWFLGGPTSPSRNRLSMDDRYLREDHYWSFIADMWRTLGSVTAEHGHVIIRIGSRTITPKSMKEKLRACAKLSSRNVKLVSSRVTSIKKRQTDAFRPGTTGCKVELDCHFQFAD